MKTTAGFTLIELLVVVLIIGILAAVALPQYNKAVMKSRAMEVKMFIANVEKAMELYVIDNGLSDAGYISWDALDIDVSSVCNSIGDQSGGYKCTAKNFTSYAPYMYASGWSLSVYFNSNTIGPGAVSLFGMGGSNPDRACFLQEGSMKAKPFCEAIIGNDSRWRLGLPS